MTQIANLQAGLMFHIPVHRSERPPFFKRIGPYLLALILLGLAVPILVYLGIMQTIGWRTPVVGVNGAMSYVAPKGGSVILYASPNTGTYLEGVNGKYEVLLVPWRNYFQQRGIGFKEIQDIAQLSKQQGGVLVLPSAVALSTEERAGIMAFHANGGAILTTWATGSRNSKGDWEGWQFLDGLGVKMVGEIPPGDESNNLILTGESPVSFNHPAGRRIFMSKVSEALLRVKGEVVAARFMNWSRITDDKRRDEGAVVFSETASAAGRTAYFAFAETTWESHPLALYDVIDDTIHWLQREPVILRAAWPKGKLAAQVIEMDTEQGFPNALPFASMMKAANFPATFYVLTSVGKLFPAILTQLASEFEIGYHGDVHDSFKGQSASLQEKRMQTMRAEMSSVIRDTKDITGFRAPTEGYDATTEQLLPKFGIWHHTADPSRSEGRLPLLLPMEGIAEENTLVVLPRTQRDDINLSRENLSAEQTTKALIDDVDLAINTGALGLLSIHSQNFSADGVLTQAMPGLLEHLKQRQGQVWLATAGQVAEWWRERQRLKLSSANTGKRLEFNITITGQKPLQGASLIVILPQKGVVPVVQSTKIGGIKPTVTRIDNYRASVVFDSLEPGNYFYQATFAH